MVDVGMTKYLPQRVIAIGICLGAQQVEGEALPDADDQTLRVKMREEATHAAIAPTNGVGDPFIIAPFWAVASGDKHGLLRLIVVGDDPRGFNENTLFA